jgi:hypothetical protein
MGMLERGKTVRATVIPDRTNDHHAAHCWSQRGTRHPGLLR